MIMGMPDARTAREQTGPYNAGPGAPRHPTFGWGKVMLVGLWLLLAVVTLSIPLMLRSMDEAVARTMRFELAWTAQNGRTELNQAYRKIAAIDHGNGRVEDAELAVDILYSRMKTWGSGKLAEFINQREYRQRLFASITAGLKALDRHTNDLSDTRNRREALILLEKIEPEITEIASETVLRFSQTQAQNTDEMRFYNRAQMTVVGILVLFGFLLTLGLMVQNRRLAASNQRQIEISRQNAFLADHDTLTGLPNRKQFLCRLEAALKRACAGRAVGVITIDLDGFKPVNDVLGHKAGDLLLISIAERLRLHAALAEGGLAARFGGDEFLILIEGVNDPEMAEAFAQHVSTALRAPMMVGEHRIAIGATIGLAVSSTGHETADELIQNSDIALNSGKATGKGEVRSFHPKMLEGAALRGQLEADLNSANLERDIEVHYQPVIDLTTRRIIGVEALARWRHPIRGLIPPTDFIPIAESSGRIVDMGAIILRKACADAMTWPRAVTLAVNLSPVQLIRDDVSHLIRGALEETGLPASRLKLEITEGVLIRDELGTSRLLRELQDLGVSVSLDDFGTGFSSLSYLRRFRFDELKMDRSFLAGVERGGEAAAVVQTILALARSLDMSVVAEGIETEEQALLLTAMGCAKGQGWHFGKAVSGALLQTLLQDEPLAICA